MLWLQHAMIWYYVFLYNMLLWYDSDKIRIDTGSHRKGCSQRAPATLWNPSGSSRWCPGTQQFTRNRNHRILCRIWFPYVSVCFRTCACFRPWNLYALWYLYHRTYNRKVQCLGFSKAAAVLQPIHGTKRFDRKTLPTGCEKTHRSIKWLHKPNKNYLILSHMHHVIQYRF